MPIRIHELLLSLAGRLDDDALADARQMLASAELDRALEFVAGCLAAGGVVLTGPQHDEIEELFANTHLDPSVIDRVVVRDNATAYRHRFAVGPVDGREPDRGVADAVRPVLDVLPDVRSVWCVWRLTPSGPVSGPVPHRLVLVGVGPGGFAPATAYRVEYALRRAGIRASVEVLVDGAQPTEYHQEAMRCARQVPFDDPGPGGGGRPSMSPVEPVHGDSFAAEPARAEAPGAFAAEPATVNPAATDSGSAAADADSGPFRADPAAAVDSVLAVDSGPFRADPAAAVDSVLAADSGPAPVRSVAGSGPAAVQSVASSEVTDSAPAAPAPVAASASSEPEPKPPSPFAVEPPRIDSVRSVPPSPPPPSERPSPPSRPQRVRSVESIKSVFEEEREVEEPKAEPAQPASALSVENPTNSAPSPRRRGKRSKNEDEPPSRPRLVPAEPPDPAPVPPAGDRHSAALVDDILNTQERNLLRELQDELARREKQDNPGPWRSGRHGKPATPFDQPAQTGPVAVNGVPPHPDSRGYGSA